MRKKIGEIGERLACDFLKRKGYKIIDQNYRTRGGEIDIVAKEGDFFVFVEVKTRTNRTFGFPEEAIDSRKLHKLAQTAEQYFIAHHLYNQNYRIDAVSVEIDQETGKMEIRHEKDVADW